MQNQDLKLLPVPYIPSPITVEKNKGGGEGNKGEEGREGNKSIGYFSSPTTS